MKKHLYLYAILVAVYLSYHLYEPIQDPRTDGIVDILLVSVIFGYMAWMAWVVLRKLRK